MSTEQKLRQEILSVLRNIDSGALPLVAQRLKTKDGYMFVEKSLIEMALEENLPPISAVSQLESALAES